MKQTEQIERTTSTETLNTQPTKAIYFLRIFSITTLLFGLILFSAMFYLVASGPNAPIVLKMQDAGPVAFIGLITITFSLPPLTRKTKGFDATIGIAMTFCLILLLEWGVRWIAPQSTDTSYDFPKQTIQANGAINELPHPHIGYTYAPNQEISKVIQQLDEQGDILSEETRVGRTDQYGRRLVPITNLEDRPYHIIFFGGSFTSGFTLDDQHSLPTQLGQQLPTYAPYNYGVDGYGTQNILALLETTDLTTQVSQPEGIAIYVFMADHIQRVIGHSSVIWQERLPYYQLDQSGTAHHQGKTLTSARPLRGLIQGVLLRSELAKLFNVGFPRNWTEDHYQLTTQLILQAKAEYQAQFGPENQFIVVIYPFYGAPELLPYLDTANIDYINYDFLSPYGDTLHPDYWQAGGHPKALTHAAVAHQLAQDLAPYTR